MLYQLKCKPNPKKFQFEDAAKKMLKICKYDYQYNRTKNGHKPLSCALQQNLHQFTFLNI
jgi:hypothetical protein